MPRPQTSSHSSGKVENILLSPLGFERELLLDAFYNELDDTMMKELHLR